MQPRLSGAWVLWPHCSQAVVAPGSLGEPGGAGPASRAIVFTLFHFILLYFVLLYYFYLFHFISSYFTLSDILLYFILLDFFP